VTGGDSGIGRAICLSFVLEGAAVAFTYVAPHEEKDANNTLQMLKEARKGTANSKEPIAIQSDIGYENNCKKVVHEVINAFGRIDILVNNIAESHMTPGLDDVAEEQLDRIFRTNIFSYFFMSKYVGYTSVSYNASNPKF
jgi:NAD(P)-dependent dehydrogenase (short-subunit alcohol dehydrogenase family)